FCQAARSSRTTTAILVSKRMGGTMPDRAAQGLERSCSDWLRQAAAQPELERFEAFFAGHAYDAHRHDSYAVGITLDGLQCFDYRGAEAGSRPGNVIVL